jgi:site-specific recombinase XerD
MFYLDKPKAEKSYIMLSLYCSDGRLRYSTEESCNPDNWSPETNRILIDRTRGNINLDKIEKAIKALKNDLKLHGEPMTKDRVKSVLDKLLNKGKAGSAWSEIIEKLIADRESGRVLTPGGKQFSWHTIKGYRHTLSNLQKFSAATKTDLAFEKITMLTYERLISFFNNNHDHALNSLGKTVKNWKVFIKAAYKAGYHENKIFEREEFKVPYEETFDIYLTEKELEKMYNHRFLRSRLEVARDWFIIDCYCGLRICDIQVLSQKNIIDGYIRLANEKTDIAVMVPFHPYVRAITKKWKGLPPKMSDQKLNQYIKEVAEIAGIKGQVLYTVTKGGRRQDFYLEKWQMVSNHTARRSFITNLLKAGEPHSRVMRLAGIKKLTTLQRYDKESVEETAVAMSKSKFFKPTKNTRLKIA